MTVEHLIEALERMPPNQLVVWGDPLGDQGQHITHVELVSHVREHLATGTFDQLEHGEGPPQVVVAIY